MLCIYLVNKEFLLCPPVFRTSSAETHALTASTPTEPLGKTILAIWVAGIRLVVRSDLMNNITDTAIPPRSKMGEPAK